METLERIQVSLLSCASRCPNVVGKTVVLLLDHKCITVEGSEFYEYINETSRLVANSCALFMNGKLHVRVPE